MRTFFAIVLLAHVLSASAGEQSVASLDKAAATLSLTDLCNAPEVDYKAISDKMGKSPYDRDGAINCIKAFCANNDVRGLGAIHSVPRTKDRYSHFGLLRATISGSVDAIEFYAGRADVGDKDLLEHAKLAAKSGHLDAVRCLLSHEKFPHDYNSGFSILLEAVEEGHADVVRWILDEYITPSQSDLYVAALTAHSKSRWDIIDILTQHGFDIEDDGLGFRMREIRNAYSKWKAQRTVSTEAAEGPLPKETVGIATEQAG